MQIFIYQDFVHNTAPLYKALGEKYGHENLRYVNAHEIVAGILDTKPDMFVMPGGASRYMAAKLNGAGNAAIKNYVAGGGRYLGICGGAYYACTHTIWAKGTPHELDIVNELAFFKGDAVGPALGTATNMNTGDIRIVQLDKGPAVYWAGAQFVPYADADYKTLARFCELTNNNAAVIEGSYESGKYLLMSPHLEIDHTAINLMRFDVPQNKYPDIAALPDTTDITLDIFNELLGRFLDA